MRLHVWHVAHFKTVCVQNYLSSSILLFEGTVFSMLQHTYGAVVAVNIVIVWFSSV